MTKTKAPKSKPKSKPKSVADRDREYRENMKATGFARVHVFVHVDDIAKVRDFARELREKKMGISSKKS